MSREIQMKNLCTLIARKQEWNTDWEHKSMSVKNEERPYMLMLSLHWALHLHQEPPQSLVPFLAQHQQQEPSQYLPHSLGQVLQ